MDDLDHSIHIAEYDWSSFYDESEECNLLQPSLAYSDDSDLSDSEDSGNSSLVYSYCQQGTQRNPDAESNTAEERCTGSAKLPDQLNQNDNKGPVDDVATSVKQVEMCASYPTINKDAVHMELAQKLTEMSDSILNTLQTDPLNVQCSGETKEQTKDCILQTESDLKSTKEPDPLSCNQMGLNVSELDITARAISVIKAEKERWFVTVNDNPTRQRGRSTSLKKKRKIKKPCEGGRTHSLRQESSAENGVEMNKDKHESKGGRDAQSNQTKKPGGHQCEQIKAVQVVSESSKKLLVPQSFTENITAEVINRSKCESDSSASASPDTFMPLQVEHVQSNELDDSAELFSIHSYDSETYLSAAESTEEPQCLLQCYLKEHPQSSLSPTCDRLAEKTDTDQAKGRQMYSEESALSSDVAATDCEDYESTRGESPVMFPSAGQVAIETPDDDSTCKNDPSVETSGPQTLSVDLSESVCSQGDQLAPLSVPNLTVSPCSVADSPETYAKTAGHSQPVYAISAFWDEMEKLTINDILQLRMGKNSPPKQTQETVKPNADVFSTNHTSNVGLVEYGLADSSLMDTSDTADSDYFTQTDEAKPDHSSGEFSTSDFEEEYWQFIKTNGNPIPDQNSNNQQRNSLSHEDDSTNSEGRETPMPLKYAAEQPFDSQEPQTLTSWPRRLTKSNSMYNVQAFKTETVSLLPLLSHDSSSSISRPLPLEENADLKASSGLETLIPASFSSYTDLLNAHYQISFPEMFEYFFTEDNTNTDSLYAAVYDPEDISVAPVFDHNFFSFGEDTSSSSLLCRIPIFSCSHPTVRELTFPKQHYVLSANCEEMDKISPFRVASHSFIQTDLLGCSAEAAGGSHSWKSLLSLRKIRFHDKGSIWCRGSGAWMFPVENEEIPIRRENQTVVVLNERRICPASSQVYRELKEQQRILETICIKREGIFSSVKQSDMCLVCIAFASWVLRSSDPEGADAWKAALLANVSALSAIQYLRQYVKKKDPPDDL